MKLNNAIRVVAETLESKLYGKEYVSKCPFCEDSKNKFYLNSITGQYSCKRASCGAGGNLNSLFQKLNINDVIEYDDEKYNKTIVASIVLDEEKIRDVDEVKDLEILNYMKSRGISGDVIKERTKIYDENKIIFISRNKNNDIVCAVTRDANKNVRISSGSKNTLWGLDKTNPEKNDGRLYVTEGHIDALTLMELGIENVVSMQFGASGDGWIENNWEELNKFNSIVLCFDNDDAGKRGLDKVRDRLSFAKLYTLNYKECNDVNEMYTNDFISLVSTVNNPKEIMLNGFISLQEVSTSTKENVETLKSSGLVQIDSIMGGTRNHETTIICSSSGTGKTTVMSNLIKGYISQGHKVGLWSGELSNKSLKTWIYSTIAGEKSIDKVPHPFRNGEFLSSIKPEYETRINKAVDGKMFVYDGDNNNGFNMLKHFELLHKKNGVSVFFIDNASILDMSVKGVGKYEGEEMFAQALAKFTKNLPVHIYLIMHPTKTSLNTDPNFTNSNGKVKPPEKYDQYQVKGSSAIVNLAQNIMFLQRANQHLKAYYIQRLEELLSKGVISNDVFNTRSKQLNEEFSLLAYMGKNREGGYVNEDALFGYQTVSRRIYGLSSKNEDLSKEVLQEEDSVGFINDFIDLDEL